MGAMTSLARGDQFGFLDPMGNPAGADDCRKIARTGKTLFRPSPGEVRDLWETVSWAFDLYDHACYADFSLDSEGIIRGCNRQTERLLGHERNDFFGKPLHFLYPDTPQGRGQAARLVDLCMQGAGIQEEELQLRKADGKLVWVVAAAKPILKEDGTVQEIRLAAADISSLKAAEADERTARTLTALGTLAGGIAHDFNNILAVCQGSIDLARMELSLSMGKANAHLDRLDNACRQAAALARRLLTFSNGGDPITSSVSPETILKAFLADIAPESSGLDIKIHVPGELPSIDVDGRQICQALGELMANAREAARGGQAVVSISAMDCLVREGEDRDLKAGRYVKILFADMGVGIAGENLPRIFDPYFTTKPMGSEKGRGLGLAICRSIIRRHGGGIRAASVEGSPTVITIHLPAATLGAMPKRGVRLP